MNADIDSSDKFQTNPFISWEFHQAIFKMDISIFLSLRNYLNQFQLIIKFSYKILEQIFFFFFFFF